MGKCKYPTIATLAKDLSITTSILRPILKKIIPEFNIHRDLNESEYNLCKKICQEKPSISSNGHNALSVTDSFFPVFDVHYYYGVYNGGIYTHNVSDHYTSVETVIGDFVKFYNLLVGATIITLITGRDRYDYNDYLYSWDEGYSRGVCNRSFFHFLYEQEKNGKLQFLNFGGGAYFIIPISKIEYEDYSLNQNDYIYDENTHEIQKSLMNNQNTKYYNELLTKLYNQQLGIIDILKLVHIENTYNKAFDKSDYEYVLCKLDSHLNVKLTKYLSSYVYIRKFLKNRDVEKKKELYDKTIIEVNFNQKKKVIEREYQKKINDLKFISNLHDETLFFRTEIEHLRKKFLTLTIPKDKEETKQYIINLEHKIEESEKTSNDKINTLINEKEKKISELRCHYFPNEIENINNNSISKRNKDMIRNDLYFALVEVIKRQN